ncbi:response regulator [Methylotuvimicrobium buryatense]|uniref:Response regulator transcription factor n=1 Tax=Methylotuvimicrobium buryatense TaxID=95641 RepID=A0A4P9USJ2_METBY|nr:response regulator [Methylotuvimicrobium buryatense]QCW84509.1 response regulator transcription factor [Methylotuvimicrobium buryatense]
MKLMVVEDSPLVRQRIIEMLSLSIPEHSLLEADSVETAIALATVHHPEIVLLDLCLEDGHGFEVLKAIKSKCEVVHILVMTLVPTEQHKKRALQYGASYFFDKIKDYNNIIEVITGLVGRPDMNSKH